VTLVRKANMLSASKTYDNQRKHLKSWENGLLFHMSQPTSRSIIKAIACSKPTISEH